MPKRVLNFGAGPAALPDSVLEQARDEMLSFRGTGMSVMEISHRSRWADEMFAEAESNLRELLAVPDDFRVLFLQGGGKLQFSMIPMNFLGPDQVADYVITGHWGSDAVTQAHLEGRVNVAWSGEKERFVRVPRNREIALTDGSVYTYFVSNETIEGVQFEEAPRSTAPLVCDASSDFLSRPVDLAGYGLYYACAQKNAGPAGLTVVLVSDELLERTKPGLHKMLDYRRHVAAGSRLNTPPMFAVYLFLLITRWIKDEMGGIEALAKFNRRKAETLYDALDQQNDFYRTHAQVESRSLMNVTFKTPSPELDEMFLAGALKRELQQLAGHRSVGGMRASLYNAMTAEGVDVLCEYLREFRVAHA